MKNKVMLITYADSFGKNLKELKGVLDRYFKREVNAVHVLPFYPSSGDRGFAPIDYRKVAEEFGDWEDIRALAGEYELMFDFMINHLSRRSLSRNTTLRNMRTCSCVSGNSGPAASPPRSRWTC